MKFIYLWTVDTHSVCIWFMQNWLTGCYLNWGVRRWCAWTKIETVRWRCPHTNYNNPLKRRSIIAAFFGHHEYLKTLPLCMSLFYLNLLSQTPLNTSPLLQKEKITIKRANPLLHCSVPFSKQFQTNKQNKTQYFFKNADSLAQCTTIPPFVNITHK